MFYEYGVKWRHLKTLNFHFIYFYIDVQVRDLERVNNRDRHNQENKKKAADTAFKANNHDEAYRLYQEALAVDKHNQSYRDLLNKAKQELAKLSRKDFYGNI